MLIKYNLQLGKAGAVLQGDKAERLGVPQASDPSADGDFRPQVFFCLLK